MRSVLLIVVMAVVGLTGPVLGGEKKQGTTSEFSSEDFFARYEKRRQEEGERRKIAASKAESGDRKATLDLCDNEKTYWSMVGPDKVSALRSRAGWCERAGKPFLAEELRRKSDNIEDDDAFKRGDYAFIVKRALPKAEAGDLDAQAGLCFFYWHGLGLPEDGKKASYWCAEASKKDKYFSEVSNLIQKITAVLGASETPNKSEALQRLEALAVDDDGQASWLLYQAHNKLLVSINEKDQERGDKWLISALEKNYPEAVTISNDAKIQVKICEMYWHGIGSPENSEKAVHWCKKAEEETEKAAEFLSLISEISTAIGADAPPTKTEALRKIEAMANLGDGKAQWLMFRAHDLHLVSIEKEKYEIRQRWLDAAIESNHPEALVEVAWPWLTSDEPETQKKFIDYMTRAADQGNTDAMNRLGLFYLPNEYGNEPEKHHNYTKATKWYRMAAEAGDGDLSALYRLLQNRNNPERDFDEGLKWLALAAKDVWGGSAKIDLAEVLLSGDGLPKDQDRANQLMTEAVSQQFADFSEAVIPGNYMLGMNYLYRHFQKPDFLAAEKHFRAIFAHRNAKFIEGIVYGYGREAAHQYGASAYELAKMYIAGYGDKSNKSEARKYLEIAAKFGDKRANRIIQFDAAKASKIDPSVLRKIQSSLNRLGYNAGTTDGVFGEKSFNALRAFQCAHDLDVDGMPTKKVLALLERQNRNRKTPSVALTERLYSAIKKLDVDCVRSALAHGANPNATKYQSGLLDFVSKYTDELVSEEEGRDLRFQVTKLLIEAGSKISRSNSNVFSAISDGDLRLLKFLLDNGESPVRRIDGKTLMHWAAHYDQPASVELLVKYGVPRLSKRQMAQERITNAISGISSSSGIPIVEHGLKNGARVNGEDAAGLTPLVSAVNNGVYERSNYQLIKYLLDQGADPNRECKTRGRQGGRETWSTTLPLHRFISANRYSMNPDGTGRSSGPKNKHVKDYATAAMHLLLKRGAKVAGRDAFGRTPLHVAASAGNFLAAQVLLKAGAVVTHRDKREKTPLDYAETAEMIALLQKPVRSERGREKQEPQDRGGSGFVVSKMGHVVTNAHVVKDCERVTAGDDAKKQSPVEVISTDKRNDLALLKMSSAGTESIIRKLGVEIVPLDGLLRSEDVELGEKVMVAGYPYGDLFSNTIKVTSGIISAVRGISDDSGQFQMDAAVQSGNSGGPVYDENGNIVGVVVAQLNKLKVAKAIGSLPENVNFGIKASTVRQFLIASGLPSKWAQKKKVMTTKQLAKIAEKQTLMVICHQ